MTSEELRTAMDFAVDVAWQAGRVSLAHYQTGVAAELKDDDSPVTAADRGAERLARRLIAHRFPDDAILGEEAGETQTGAARRWVLDPIDGTRTFIRGVPLFGVLVALEVDREAVVGVMHFPALHETVSAAHGLGCWWDGRPARVSSTDRLADALVLTTDIENIERTGRRDGWDRLRAGSGLCRTWGDCYGYALVATGRAEAMLDPILSHWDRAALAPIITEAGGTLTEWRGAGASAGGAAGADSAVATNAALGPEIRSLLTGRP